MLKRKAAQTVQLQDILESMKKTLEVAKIQSDSLHTVIKNGFSKAKQLPGSGRRPFSEDLEELVYQWIVGKRLQKQRVARKGIQQKAVELHSSTAKGVLEFLVLSKQRLAGKVHVTLFVIAEKKTTHSQ